MNGASILRNEHKQRAQKMTEEERIVRRRFALLQYDDYGDSSDSGGGEIATSILQSVSQLGSAYLISQNQPLTTQSPVLVRPPAAYGALSSPGSSAKLFFIVAIVFVIGLLVYSKA